MTSTGTFQGFSDEKKKSSKVLKPPGGGSSDIFGAAPEETSPRRVKNHNQSQLGSALFGDTAPNNSNSNETPRNKPDGNPVTGIGYGESQNNGPAVQNGTTSSNSSEKSNDTSPAAKVPARTRVPPGGYSSGLW